MEVAEVLKRNMDVAPGGRGWQHWRNLVLKGFSNPTDSITAHRGPSFHLFQVFFSRIQRKVEQENVSGCYSLRWD